MKHIRLMHKEDYRIFTVATLEAELNGQVGEFYQIEAPNWVNIIAEQNGKLLVESQYRIGVEREVLELPGGIIEQDESPVEAALRELAEETGYTGHARLIGMMDTNPAIMSNQCATVVVEQLHDTGTTTLDAFEEITTMWMSINEIEAAIKDGRFTNALHIASLYQYIR